MNVRQRTARNAKISNTGRREWGGYLTPVEIVSLIDEDGFKPSSPRDVERAREKVAAGNASPTWFYFKVPKAWPGF